MRLGFGLSICDIRSAAALPVFDPATLSLTGWWRASFSASPWTGTASAGASGGRDLTEATNPPATTTAVNGFVPALFDGVNDRLVSTNNSNFVSTNAGTFVGLIKPVSVVADGSPAYTLPALWCDSSNAYMGAGISSAGFRPFNFDNTSATYKERTIACAAGAWHLVAMTWNGTTLAAYVDSLTDTIACSATVIGPTPMYIGSNYAGTAFGNFQALEIMYANAALSSGNISSLYSYFKARYPAAGLV